MPDEPKIHRGKVLPPAKGGRRSTKSDRLPTIEAFTAFNQFVEAARDCIKTHEEQATIRSRIGAYEATEVARIKAGEAVLKDYFSQIFAERRSLYDELFSRLDQALEDGNGKVLHSVVRGIVDIAQNSPLADIGDLSQVRAALDDPDQVWDL